MSTAQIFAYALGLLSMIGLATLAALIISYFTDNSDPDLPEVLPEAGERWGLKDDSPWPVEDWVATIIERKDGWVRFDFRAPDEIRVLKDRRELIDSFVIRFGKIEKKQTN